MGSILSSSQSLGSQPRRGKRHYYAGQRKAEPSHIMEERKITRVLWNPNSNGLSFVSTVYQGWLYASFTSEMVESKNNLLTFDTNSLQGFPCLKHVTVRVAIESA